MSPAARRRRTRAWPIITLGSIAVVGAAAVGHLLVVYPDTPGPGAGREVIIEVPWGGGARAAARQAVAAGAVRDELRFTAYLRLCGAARRIKAGRHMVRDDWSPARIARALAGPGMPEQARVTIREGWTIFDIAGELDRKGVVQRAAFLEAARSPALLAHLGIEGESAEGYLFPETYLMELDTAPSEVIERLVGTFRRRAGPLFVAHADEVRELERTAEALARELSSLASTTDAGPAVRSPGGAHVAVILASMVEAETARLDERPLVAAVLLNRLRAPGFTWRKLQIDPTVRYGCEAEPERAPSCRDGASPLTSRHLDDGRNRFNTYVHPGLPPGPIGNPSISAIEAVLTPAPADFLYFVADGSGGHVFSSTLPEHNAAVARYRALQGGPDGGAPAPAGR